VHFTAPSVAIGLVVTGAARSVSDQSTVSVGQRSYSLDGELQDALGQAGWSSTPSWNQYAVFRQRLVRPPVWLAAAAPGGIGAPGLGHRLGLGDRRRARPVPLTVVRSEAYLDGWRVEAVSASGRTRSLPVEAHGLIQSVRVPAGSWTITFLYRARARARGSPSRHRGPRAGGRGRGGPRPASPQGWSARRAATNSRVLRWCA